MGRIGWQRACVASFICMTGFALSRWSVSAPPPAGAPAAHATAGSADVGKSAEHRYRIVGRVRLVFWAGSNDVGTARLNWHSNPQGTTITLLAGSDPDRAPRRLNQWAYVREEERSGGATVFLIRSATDQETRPPSAAAARRDDPRLTTGCVALNEHAVNSIATTVPSPGATYRTVDRFLDQLVESPPKWQEQHRERPADAAPGFLTALQRVLQSASESGDQRTVPPVTFVYNNKLHDLSIHRLRPLGRTVVGTRVFDRLTRGDLVMRNHDDNNVTKFAVTYAPGDGDICLPVQIFYQPNFWVAIELQLDDQANPPADPASDASALARIRRICAPATQDR